MDVSVNVDKVNVQSTQPQRDIVTQLNRWQAIAPIVSCVLAVLSFVFGGIYSAYQSRQTKQESENTEWRTALEKVDFQEKDLIANAFLLESFDVPAQNAQQQEHKDQARRLEMAMLDRTTQPEVFDLIFQNMLMDAEAGDVEDMLLVASNLDDHLATMYQTVKKDLPADHQPASEDEFLVNPTKYLSRPQDKDRLNQTLLLLWELDTFSNGMDCIWNTPTSRDCPHRSDPPAANPPINIILLNYTVPNKPNVSYGFRTVHTCSVQRMDDQYSCE